MLRELHQIRVPVHCLSQRERACLTAAVETAIPAGRLQPGAGAECVAKVEAYLASLTRSQLDGYRAMLHALDAAAYRHGLRPFARLTAAKRLDVLERWRKGNYLFRTLLRLLFTPVKMAHFDSPDFYRAMGCVYETPARKADQPRYVTERTLRASTLEVDEDVECDVVVVGTGAGGAVVGRELAERGLAVVFLEEGEYHTRADFTGRTADAQRRLYRDVTASISVGNTGIPIPVGRSVGGSTTINSGTCYRVPDRVLRKWREDFGLSELTPDHMAPYFERVEQVLGVGVNDRKYLGRTADIIARGCDRLGYKHAPLKRNAPECDGQGLCCLGCPTDAKRSTNVSYIPLALRAGAQLFTGAKVQRILTESGRAVGVVARATGGRRAYVTVRARAVVIACGTFYTPVLLDRCGLGGGSGQLGKNLSIHPAQAALAWFDEEIKGYNAVPQGYAIHEFHDEGLLFEGGSAPIDFGSATIPLLGPRFVDLMESFDHVAMFGFMIEDTSRGRVWNRDGKPFITYMLNDQDVAKIKRGIEILARVFFAAGARSVMPLVHGFDELRGEADLERFRRATITARDYDLTAYHPLGTARMGVDPRTSVINTDHQVHDTPGLYVVDGAAVPSSLAVNPQVTIMALATRAAERIADRLEATGTA